MLTSKQEEIIEKGGSKDGISCGFYYRGIGRNPSHVHCTGRKGLIA